MILAFSFSLIALFSSIGLSVKAQSPSKSLKRIVIDPGHGGTDIGSKGKYSTEAAVSLAVSLKLETYIKQAMPDVEVVMTRTTDIYHSVVEKAKIEMKNKNFSEATKFWKKASEKVEKDTYFIQQLAFCTYKDESVSNNIALIDALKIISQLEPEDRNTTDPETLGITGAIYKRLWINNKETVEYLDRAIEYYKRGFTINQDYYTGENYALCLDLKSEISTDSDEKIYLSYSAKNTRTEIIEIINKLSGDEDFEIRSDLKWIYATLSHCYFAIGDTKNHILFDKKFKEQNPEQWESETYQESLDHLNKINKTY